MVKSDTNNDMDSVYDESREVDYSKKNKGQSHEMGSTGVFEDEKPVLKRRNFIQKTILGFAGLSLLPNKSNAKITNNSSEISKDISFQTLKEDTYWKRTDSFEEKLSLLQKAWDRRDYRVVNSISNSIRISGIQAQADQTDVLTPDSSKSHFVEVSALPDVVRNWAKGWKFCKIIGLDKTAITKRNISDEAEYLGYPVNHTPDPEFRSQEPIDLLLEFPASQVKSLKREIRVARIINNSISEVTSQVYEEIRRKNEWYCHVTFMADSNQLEQQKYLVFYGNPDAELPDYVSDLDVTGDGYALDIENLFYKVKLSRQTGQIESLFYKRLRGLELYSGGEGHGEPPGIDWSHDYIAQGYFQKLRTTLWDECPDYEIIRGPVCTIVRRWGFPYSPLHPLFSPSRINMYIEYRFYSGLPYFIKSSKFTTLKELIVDNLRDDEWVLTGQAFTHSLWIGEDGKVNFGAVKPGQENNLWGVGLYDKENTDAFIGIFLEHRAEGLASINHSGPPILNNKWHGQLWRRHVVDPNTKIPSGTNFFQKNAYLTIPFTEAHGPGIVEDLRTELLSPLKISTMNTLSFTTLDTITVSLAKAGEAGDAPIPKELLWKALELAKDGQFLTGTPMPGLLSVAELGYVYDIQIKGDDTVLIIFAMPHRGRPLGVYFESGSNSHPSYKGSLNVPETLLKVSGVKKVIFKQTWYPEWTSNLITDSGRKKLQLPEL
jgi:metal-sulfur cluster biosynthetic enzyme